jgi:hypothetical protein
MRLDVFLACASEDEMRYGTLGLFGASLAIVIGAVGWVNAQSKPSPLEGAWTIQQITFAKPPANPPNNPTGLILFVGNHYSNQHVDNSSRPAFGEGGAAKATADQLRAIWGGVTSNGGTFTVSGNTIRFVAIVAKNPNLMAAGAWGESTFTLNGDTLVLTTTRNNNGPEANPQTIRLTRAK